MTSFFNLWCLIIAHSNYTTSDACDFLDLLVAENTIGSAVVALPACYISIFVYNVVLLFKFLSRNLVLQKKVFLCYFCLPHPGNASSLICSLQHLHIKILKQVKARVTLIIRQWVVCLSVCFLLFYVRCLNHIPMHRYLLVGWIPMLLRSI